MELIKSNNRGIKLTSASGGFVPGGIMPYIHYFYSIDFLYSYSRRRKPVCGCFAPGCFAPGGFAPGCFAPGSFAPGGFAPGGFAPGGFAPGSIGHR